MKYVNWLVICACVGLLSACGDPDGGFGERRETEQANYGEECGGLVRCRAGLSCLESICKPTPTAAGGEACEFTEGCKEGLYCDATAGTCAEAGDAEENAGCGSTAECKPGLICVLEGFSGTCKPSGTGGVGSACSTVLDCAAGLSCVPAPASETDGTVCAAAPPVPDGLFTGVACEPDADDEVEAFFELPDDEITEFYRLPFPNDIRIEGGHPDMSGHPTPGPGYVGFDIVQRYLDAVQSSQDRFGLNQTVYFRFDGAIDFGTLSGSGENPTLEFVNIDAGSERYNRRRGMSWRFGTGARRYICQNWLTVRPQSASPMLPDTTYAVVLRTGVKDNDGNDVVADDDFKALMEDTKPDSVPQAAWDAYQPLRDWVSEQGIDKSTVLSAAVFTTGNPRKLSPKLRAAARQSVPELSEATLCDEGSTSPCDDGLEGEAHMRGCFGTSEAFHEIHGKLSLPVFQEGDAPYAEQGGAISMAGETPQKVRDEEVCAAMTVPRGMMPAEGWPLLIYAHGTGGTFRSHVDQVSPVVSTMDVDGEQTGMIVIGWDQVLHYTRRGESNAHPNGLVYNYANPDAALGNFLQGTADIHALVAFAETFSLPADQSPTGEAIEIDPTKIYFMGHSQGGTTGPIALPYDDTIQGAVLSGSGAQIGRALLGKTSPLDAKAALMVAIQDPDVGLDHPVISLLQGYFDPVDPLNYASHITARQTDGETYPSHVFHLYGKGDTYTPPDTLEIMAHAMHIPYIGSPEFETSAPDVAELPVSGNLTTGEVPYTAVGRQYAPDDYDGHFVGFRNAEATDDLKEFFGSSILAEDGVPTIAD